ncbi:hypothetical protein DFA_01359 [Cavenderia fasciculata]|uniref:Uncharacterized protein n=1 Tax=Cavenderia fasciculata TaxID=261658 RepID=F4PS90_CACFS|nr:uncharacterized protein DFA_01359 [Cavenderia fasciculata]EGG21473.1 hypothetical protein DFA_01359 [Cavenderia fasciculata]|eukprot:XP_004359323.1 hypothetical protein DFA_01359 [Cavenderia fasciculata]
MVDLPVINTPRRNITLAVYYDSDSTEIEFTDVSIYDHLRRIIAKDEILNIPVGFNIRLFLTPQSNNNNDIRVSVDPLSPITLTNGDKIYVDIGDTNYLQMVLEKNKELEKEVKKLKEINETLQEAYMEARLHRMKL